MANEQKYSSVRKFPGFELRKYQECVLADVSVSTEFTKAGNSGFGPLFGYISGRNELGTEISMTSPVIQQPKGASHLVSFVMPADFDGPKAPAPTDSRVSIRTVPEELVAVDRFSGRWSESGYLDRVAKLQIAITAADYVAAGEARFARFDPPWTPWFRRRNEIQIPVTQSP